MKIGLIGLGRMGRAIQARLAAQGFDVVGWDRDAAAMQRAAGNGMTIAAHPRAVADAADGTVISIITEDNGVRERVPRQGRISVRRRARQAVHRDEHLAADDRARAGAAGRCGRRQADRLAGARHHPVGEGRQAVRHGRRQGRGPGRRAAGAGEAHPQDRAHGRQRRGLRDEARGQSRARRVHPGDRASRSRSAPAKACRCRRCSTCSAKRRPPTAGSTPRRSCLPASPTTSRSI